MAKFNDNIERAASAAQSAAQGGGQSKMLQYMLARLAQNAQHPAPTRTAAATRLLGTFLLPMIVQGMQSWKDRYDARGDFKNNGEELLRKQLAGEQLSPERQRMLDTYRAKYPKEYEAALASLGGQPTAPQPTPQQPPPQDTSIQPSVIAQEIAKAAQLPNSDWQAQEHPAPETLPEANAGEGSDINYGDMLAQRGQEAMEAVQNIGQSPELAELLRMYGRGLR